ncbi:pyruvate dehydrogenase E1 component [Kribbella aluminosa]|uniref:Pyruvate dehydrogenase E1 component n=1 Tax=Kribbella aluminosa TaxID=416017 RepID=A0ABS4UYG7_9ACTN|nr:pyruvate dehydrogenase E1 component [Kribbella aluminosa]
MTRSSSRGTPPPVCTHGPSSRGRLSADQLDGFRQEVSRGPHNGLSSYPHPRLMPDFWEFPTVSMGLAALNSIYQARFNRYLHNRSIKDTSQQHVWAFLGDGEMGEPESLGAIGLAAREELDNLTFVINCNLQQLDGPVRGNGKVIQELEAFFRGAGWNVIKVIWGREWDNLLAQDHDGALLNKMNTTPDGQFQTYSVESGEYIRENFFGGDARLRQMVSGLSDEDLRRLPRGGHDYRKVYAAFKSATEHVGQPTVILAQTIKGWTIEALEGRNATHQMKKLTSDDLKAFRDRLYLPIEDKDLEDAYNPPYFHPGTDSPEYQYMMERRKQLGGSLPERRVQPKTLTLPGDDVYKPLAKGSHAPVATTMALVRLFRDLMKDPEIGHRIVPIAPDEYRTFGMDSMFPTAKIYSPHGQNYDAVDRNLLLSWKESTAGQLLHEGISEAGAMGSVLAASTAYATHGEPMIPFYIFYSMFGFQRTGDWMWALGDQLGRGFLIGATAGRTTLTGEGLQHADGHSPLLASTNPAAVHYDPAFAYEIPYIVKDGLRRMYGYGLDETKPYGEDVFYYLTVYNEPVPQPAEPESLDVAALLKGLYRFNEGQVADGEDAPRVQLLASGVGMPWVLKAQQILADEYSVAADVWSVTSWNELRRDAVAAEQHNLLHPDEPEQVPFVTEQLKDTKGPVVAVSDFMRAVQDQISRWVPNDYTSLGTDGWGLADTRAAARRHFQVDAESIVVATLEILAKRGDVKPEVAAEAARKFRIDDPTAVAGVKQEGAGA